MSFADRAIQFNREISYTGQPLPSGIRVMNPFRESAQTVPISEAFYRKFYDDEYPRHIILGINPSRLGAGLTGIPFTDPKRLISECGIEYQGRMAHEPSSVFVYEMIHAFGGLEAFYSKFYINSPCPLGFTSVDDKGRETNYNYYDSPQLLTAVHDFMIDSLKKIIDLGICTDKAFCFGTGKNEKYLKKLNAEHGFFGEIQALEHPRFIMQYKSRMKQDYIRKYLEALGGIPDTDLV